MKILAIILMLISLFFMYPGAWLLRDGIKWWSIVDIIIGALDLVVGLTLIAFGVDFWGRPY